MTYSSISDQKPKKIHKYPCKTQVLWERFCMQGLESIETGQTFFLLFVNYKISIDCNYPQVIFTEHQLNWFKSHSV